jgi:hypothetical protein
MEIPIFTKWWEMVVFLLFALIATTVGIVIAPIIFIIRKWNERKI